MSKILMLKGLQASGKTTYAKELVQKGLWKRVSKDDLRAMLDNSNWSHINEKFVLTLRDTIIMRSIGASFNVVVDDTNFNPIHEERLRQIATELKAEFEVKFFNVDLEECIKRDLGRPNSVGPKVIMQTYNQYLKPKPEIYAPGRELPEAILCDIDGTLAHGINVTRKPYEWHKVSTDTVDTTIRDLINSYYGDCDMAVILLSGRDSSCRIQTERWLKDNKVLYDYLFMREEGDKREDSITKRELFDKYIRDKFKIWFVLDDRNRVVDMWRSMGLKVFQVADGDF